MPAEHGRCPHMRVVNYNLQTWMFLGRWLFRCNSNPSFTPLFFVALRHLQASIQLPFVRHLARQLAAKLDGVHESLEAHTVQLGKVHATHTLGRDTHYTICMIVYQHIDNNHMHMLYTFGSWWGCSLGCAPNKTVWELSGILFRCNEARRTRKKETGFSENWSWKQLARSPFFCLHALWNQGLVELGVAKTWKFSMCLAMVHWRTWKKWFEDRRSQLQWNLTHRSSVPHVPRIGFRENLQETPIFVGET